MAKDQLSKLNPDGTSLGQSAADLVSLHGATPTIQSAAIVSVATTAVVSVCGAFAFSAAAQASAVVTALNAVLAAINAKGIIAT